MILTKETKLEECKISSRLKNVLITNDFYFGKKVKDFENMTHNDIYKFKNLGKKSGTEILELCKLCGFSLKR